LVSFEYALLPAFFSGIMECLHECLLVQLGAWDTG
jgi:hypothetical protein